MRHVGRARPRAPRSAPFLLLAAAASNSSVVYVVVGARLPPSTAMCSHSASPAGRASRQPACVASWFRTGPCDPALGSARACASTREGTVGHRVAAGCGAARCECVARLRTCQHGLAWQAGQGSRQVGSAAQSSRDGVAFAKTGRTFCRGAFGRNAMRCVRSSRRLCILASLRAMHECV